MNYSLGNMLGGGFVGGLDPDAAAYIAAVENQDGHALEFGVRKAYNNFIKGCKSDGIWDSIKASCILAGAQTLSGALEPLKGTTPTNFNFVSGDYNRKTGLVGNGLTKYLDSNRNNNADPQDNFSLSVYATVAGNTVISGNSIAAGGTVSPLNNGSCALGATTGSSRNRSSTLFTPAATGFIGFHGTSRNNSASYNYRRLQSSQVVTQGSQTPFNGNVFVFANTGPSAWSSVRLSFYHIGESVALEKLDSRVTTLMSNIATAIP